MSRSQVCREAALRTGGRRRREETHGEQYWERAILGKRENAGPGRETSVTKAEERLPRSAGKGFCPIPCPHPSAARLLSPEERRGRCPDRRVCPAWQSGRCWGCPTERGWGCSQPPEPGAGPSGDSQPITASHWESPPPRATPARLFPAVPCSPRARS